MIKELSNQKPGRKIKDIKRIQLVGKIADIMIYFSTPSSISAVQGKVVQLILRVVL